MRGGGTPLNLRRGGQWSIYLDGADRSVTAAGPRTLVLPAPVAVGGSYYVGIRQTAAVNAIYSFNREFPLRPATFFYSNAPDAGPWVDFAVAGLDMQINVGATLGACLVPLAVDLTPGAATACVGSGVAFTAHPAGSGPYAYQWTEDGVDIPGATGASHTATHGAPGTHAYHRRVTDAGGCSPTVAASPATATWVAATPPAETAAGPAPAGQLLWAAGNELVWPANPEAAAYTLYRGAGADLPGLLDATVDSCTRWVGTAPVASGLNETPAGDFYWYFVTATSACAVEGPAGSLREVDTAGACP